MRDAMYRVMGSCMPLLLGLALFGLVPMAHAQSSDVGPTGTDAPQNSPNQLIFEVPPEGGVYRVPADPNYNIVIYFPAPITALYQHSDKSALMVEHKDHVAVVRAKAQTNISVECTTELRIGILFVPVTDIEDAALQVQFQALSQNQRFERAVEREVGRRVKPIREELEHAQHDLKRRLLAKDLLTRLSCRRLRNLARTDDNVIVHFHQLCWFHNDVYLLFDLENRGRESFPIDRVSVASPEPVLHPVFAVTDNIVMSGRKISGVLVIDNALPWRGKPVEVEIVEARDDGIQQGAHHQSIRVPILLAD